MPQRRYSDRTYPERPCSVCGLDYTPRQPFGRCCSTECSMVLASMKRLKKRLGPWSQSQRDQWARMMLRAARSAWRA